MIAGWKKMISAALVSALCVAPLGEIIPTSSVYAAETEQVRIYYKAEWNGAQLFYWNQDGKCNNPVNWPGVSMEKQEDGWYSYTIENADQAQVMFHYGKKQTTHYQALQGDNYFVGNKRYDKPPTQDDLEATATPIPKPSKTPTPKATLAPTNKVSVIPTSKPTVTPKSEEGYLNPTRTVTPTSAPVATIPQKSGTIILHYESSVLPNLYYYNVNNGKNTPVAWPGVEMVSEGNNWYTYTVEQARSMVFLCVSDKGETEENTVLSGEYWLSQGMLLTEAPESYGKQPTKSLEATATPTPVKDVTKAPTATIKPIETVTPTPTIHPTWVPEITKEASLTPTSVPEPTKVVVKGKMIVHYYNADNWSKPSVHYWNATGASVGQTTWPGQEMEKESGNWYVYTIDGATASDLLFVDGSNTNAKTSDLSQKEGEWWYKDGKWSDYNPDGPTPTPGPTNTPKPTNTPRPTNTPKPTRDPNCTATPAPDYTYSEDFRDETIYFLMTARFYDGDKMNNIHADHDAEVGNTDADPAWRGDFKGLIEKLDYIKALGFTAIWITPVVENCSGYDFHGYHAVNFRKVDPRLESEGATFEDLVNACHEKGIRLIQDIVLNHTSNGGEEGLFPIVDREYVLDQGVSGNKVITTPKDSAVSKLDSLIQTISKGSCKSYNTATTDDTQNGAAYMYHARDQWMKEADTIYRKNVSIGWEDFTVTTGQFAGDCMELNTEMPEVYNYLADTYNDYIKMGVDAFRIDTVKHISRLTMNTVFLPSFDAAAKSVGNNNFFSYAEVACRVNEFVNHNNPCVSPFYYTWKSDKTYAWNDNSVDGKDNLALCKQEYEAGQPNTGSQSQPKSTNVFLEGNDYHTPDYTQSSGMGVIDYAMHFNFSSASKAFNIAKQEDPYMNDSSYNVVYVDSHDYGPSVDGDSDRDGSDLRRYTGSTEDWAENLSLMFTFRGIPCIYYGSEIQFKKGVKIDNYFEALENTGRAYFGDNLEGTVTATDFGEYTATGTVADTLNAPLSKHIRKLNKIRAAVPALRRGQYSVEGVDGNIAYKRRYTDADTDSFACIAVSGNATFTGLPGGTYVDACTGDSVNIPEGGTLNVSCSGKGNLRVYVLSTDKTPAPGVVGADIDDTFIK